MHYLIFLSLLLQRDWFKIIIGHLELILCMKVRHCWQVQNEQEEEYPQQRGDFGDHLRNTNSAALMPQKSSK
jgi:hypothetical protein